MQSSSVAGFRFGSDQDDRPRYDELPDDAPEAERWKWFGVWLAQQRLTRGLSKKEVADRAEVSVSTLATLEAGGRIWKGQWILPSPAAVTLIKIASALDLDSEAVFDRAGRTSPPAPQAPPPPSFEDRISRVELKVAEQDQKLDEILALLRAAGGPQ